MNFNNKLIETNVIVMSSHPDARFLEAQGIMKETDGDGIKPEVSEMLLVYSVDGKTLTVKVTEEDDPVIEEIDNPWLEDRVMTPYVPMTLDEAFDQMNRANYIAKSVHVVLRHPLYPGIVTPEYIFGDNKTGYISVDTFTGDVKVIK